MPLPSATVHVNSVLYMETKATISCWTPIVQLSRIWSFHKCALCKFWPCQRRATITPESTHTHLTASLQVTVDLNRYNLHMSQVIPLSLPSFPSPAYHKLFLRDTLQARLESGPPAQSGKWAMCSHIGYNKLLVYKFTPDGPTTNVQSKKNE